MYGVDIENNNKNCITIDTERKGVKKKITAVSETNKQKYLNLYFTALTYCVQFDGYKKLN